MSRIFNKHGSLFNPFILALPFAILAIFFLPDIYQKYEFNIDQSYNSTDKFIQKFIEFDGDGLSEKVILHSISNPIPTLPHISIYSATDAPQYDILLDHPWVKENNLFSADLNNNKKNELFVFTRSVDSIYLNMFEHYSSDSIIIQSVQVEGLNNLETNDDLWINHIGNSDLNGDGFEDFVFMIMTGYGQQPKGIFAWDLQKNIIIRSAPFGISFDLVQHYLCDIDQDGYEEILLSTYTNTFFSSRHNSNIDLQYPDTSSYIIVLNHDLSLRFDPIPVSCLHSYIAPIKTESGVKIAAIIGTEKEGKVEQQIQLYDLNGKLFKTKSVTNDYGHCNDWVFTKNNNIDDLLYIAHVKGLVECYDVNLNQIQSIQIKPIESFPIKPIDLDNDGQNELVFKQIPNSIFSNEFVIIQNDLSNPVNIKLEGKVFGVPGFLITHQGEWKDNKSFVLQLSNEDAYLCSYSRNPNYKFKYLIWILTYTLIIVFIAIMQWAQRIKTQNKTRKEKELARFQLLAIKNQIDPHFTLNTLNSISSLYGKGENQEAYKYMTKLSRLMLLVLNESDQISSTLRAEVEMIKNYIELQMIRFKDVFNYKIDWDEERLGEREMPRMLIHTFTENAIKHGLRLKKEGGFLKITIKEKDKHLFIIIEDNGVGRRAASQDKSLSSGKGVGISNSICQLYQQLRNVKVSYKIDDLFKLNELTNSEEPAGTRVTITVHPKLFKI